VKGAVQLIRCLANSSDIDCEIELNRIFDQFLLWILTLFAGSGTASVGYAIFRSVFSHDQKPGVMSLSFLLGIRFRQWRRWPILCRTPGTQTLSRAVKFALLAVLIGHILLSLAIFRRVRLYHHVFGIMIIPCFIGRAGFVIADVRRRQSGQTMMSVVALLPFVLGGMSRATPHPMRSTNCTAKHSCSAPDVV